MIFVLNEQPRVTGFFLPYMITYKYLFQQYVAQTSPNPLLIHINKAKGVYLYSYEGKKYIDLISGIGVSSVGHGNPKVISAIRKQLRRYLHVMVYGEMVQTPQVDLSVYLSKVLPYKEDTSVFFTNSGSEAVEGAIKLAKRYTGNHEMISLHHAYHGSTHGALSISADSEYSQRYYPLLPGVRRIRLNHMEDLVHIKESTAAVFVETIMGEAGYLCPDKDWLLQLRKTCDDTKTLLVLDEIQCGMGRTGTLFAFEHYGIEPDILLLSKAFGSGMPLGCFIAKKKIMQTLSYSPILGNISTFGGHPLSCSAALAGLKYIIKHQLWENALSLEKVFRERLTHPKIKSISGMGLMLALELENRDSCFKLVDFCIQHGVLTDWFLYAPHKLRIAPPLIMSKKQAHKVCNVLLEGLDTLV